MTKKNKQYQCANKKREYGNEIVKIDGYNYSVPIIKQCDRMVLEQENIIPNSHILEGYCEECINLFTKKFPIDLLNKNVDANLNRCGKTIRKYFATIENNKKGLFLHGGIGVGKTWASYAIIKAIVLSQDKFIEDLNSESGNYCYSNVIITSMAKAFHSMVREQSNDKYDKYETLDSLCSADVALIDDIGLEKMSEFREEALEQIINARYEDKKLTFFTSNYSLDELADKLGKGITGERMVSRIAEMCEVIEMKGEDRRK